MLLETEALVVSNFGRENRGAQSIIFQSTHISVVKTEVPKVSNFSLLTFQSTHISLLKTKATKPNISVVSNFAYFTSLVCHNH